MMRTSPLRLIVALVLLLGLVAVAPAAGSPTASPSLWLMDPDGSNQRQLSDRVSIHSGFDWSPDGTRLAYVTDDIIIFDVRSGSRTNVTGTVPSGTTGYEQYPTWSPDASQLAYEDRGDIWVIGADGTSRHRLLQTSAHDRFPEWAPTGELISYQSSPEAWGPPKLNVIDATTGAARELVEVDGRLFATSWAPDATRIAYGVRGGGIGVVDVTSGESTVISAVGYSPAWSPDGASIAYGTSEGLFIVDVATGAQRKLGDRYVSHDTGISWSPDSDKIAFGSYDIFVVDVATGAQAPLTAENETAEDDSPEWSPAGHTIAFIGTIWCCGPSFWDRSVTATLSRHLVVEGRITSEIANCINKVRIKVQRRRDGQWHTVARETTRSYGYYRLRLADRPGRYRVVTPAIRTYGYVCRWSRSDVVRHRH